MAILRQSTVQPFSPSRPMQVGQTIAGRYRVEELLGTGSAGFVVGARHLHLRQRVALKILTAYTDAQASAVDAEIARARKAASLENEHIAKILEIGKTDDGSPFVATLRLKGTTLATELAEREKLPVDEAVRWILQACEGLAEAHAKGIVHGDLKPRNVFLAIPARVKRGQTPTRTLKLLDFGMASPLASDASGDESSAWLASPAYLAPEQIRDARSADARSDVWALGVLLYELLSGRLPFEAETVSGMLIAVSFDVAPMLTEAPYELARIVNGCLSKDPSRRPQSVTALAAALAPFAGDTAHGSLTRIRAAESGSIPAMTVDSARLAAVSSSASPPTVRLAPSNAPDWDAATSPSLRVNRRRSEKKRIVGAALSVGAAITAASILFLRPAAPPSDAALASPFPGASGGATPTLAAPAAAPSPPMELPPSAAPVVTPRDLPNADRPHPAALPKRMRAPHDAGGAPADGHADVAGSGGQPDTSYVRMP